MKDIVEVAKREHEKKVHNIVSKYNHAYDMRMFVELQSVNKWLAEVLEKELTRTTDEEDDITIELDFPNLGTVVIEVNQIYIYAGSEIRLLN